MGYFSNGTEGMLYEEEYCVKCIHFDDGSCPVLSAHSLYNYKECNNPESILHMLIPREGVYNGKCLMFVAARAVGDLFEAGGDTE